jgi:hypothetical protein
MYLGLSRPIGGPLQSTVPFALPAGAAFPSGDRLQIDQRIPVRRPPYLLKDDGLGLDNSIWPYPSLVDLFIGLDRRADVGQDTMAVLRKLGTKWAIEKLGATASEKPNRNEKREGVRQAAPCSNRVHQSSVVSPRAVRDDRTIARPLSSSDPYIAFAGGRGAGRHTQSRCGWNFDLCHPVCEGEQQIARNHRGTETAYSPACGRWVMGRR